MLGSRNSLALAVLIAPRKFDFLAQTSSRSLACAGRCLLLVALLVAPLLTAAVPDLDLAKWNRAYKYEALHVPATLLKPASALYDGGSADAYVEPLFPLVGYDVQRQCKGPDAKVDPTQAKAGTCQYKVNKDGTYTYWEKQPGDWSRLTNCYCYALDVSSGKIRSQHSCSKQRLCCLKDIQLAHFCK